MMGGFMENLTRRLRRPEESAVSEPNLQNIPVRMELGRLIRKVFIPEEGYRICGCRLFAD